MALIALLLAVSSLLLFWMPPLALPGAVIAAVFSIIAISRGRQQRSEGGSEALPIVALTLAILAMIPALLIALIIALAAAIAGSFEIPVDEPRSGDFTTM